MKKQLKKRICAATLVEMLFILIALVVALYGIFHACHSCHVWWNVGIIGGVVLLLFMACLMHLISYWVRRGQVKKRICQRTPLSDEEFCKRGGFEFSPLHKNSTNLQHENFAKRCFNPDEIEEITVMHEDVFGPGTYSVFLKNKGEGEISFQGTREALEFADCLDKSLPTVSSEIRVIIRHDLLFNNEATVYSNGEICWDLLIYSKAKGILELLKTKHVILEGNDSEYRSLIIECIRAEMAGKCSIYEIPPNICSRDSYLKAIRNVFPLESPLGIDARQMNNNQVYDVQVDWIEFQKDDSFIIWNEIRAFKDMADLYGILDHYVSQKYLLEEDGYRRSFRLLVNSDILLDNYPRHVQCLYPHKGKAMDKIIDEHVAFVHV